ncbi:L-Aspartase-like protein [Aspergillus alliaceus]|uniref:L-Aspartase-like protein n=1 Tax=Petromyces alliaceus TaxID=209559 RepID=UPI0012A403E9|nr:L-Aspartase-like protein [Aspergillus alliaceus]KAB8234393.1 L-Aspartase-like protein [Aspergillus alliaceus]
MPCSQKEVRDTFTDETYANFLVQTEAALARAESKVEATPPEVGDAIIVVLGKVELDFDRLSRETQIVGYPVLPLVMQLVENTREELSKYIHWGASTQDIKTDASMLQTERGLQLVNAPFYLSSILTRRERICEIEQRCLLVRFGGAADTLASLGRDRTGIRVRAQLAKELGLEDPMITWHVARDNIAEILNFLAVVDGTLGKIALDIILISSNEPDEVAAPFGGAKLPRDSAFLGLDAMVVDFNCASGPWHLEWMAIPESSTYVLGALHQTIFALSGLCVKDNSLKKNLHSARGLIVAHDVVYEACKSASEQDRILLDVLKESTEASENLDGSTLAVH